MSNNPRNSQLPSKEAQPYIPQSNYLPASNQPQYQGGQLQGMPAPITTSVPQGWVPASSQIQPQYAYGAPTAYQPVQPSSFAPGPQSQVVPSAQGGVIKGESRIEYVPYTKEITEYVTQEIIEYVPREKKITDYYAIEYVTETIPQVIQEKYIEYVPVETVKERTEYQAVTRQQIIQQPDFAQYQQYQPVATQQVQYAPQVVQAPVTTYAPQVSYTQAVSYAPPVQQQIVTQPLQTSYAQAPVATTVPYTTYVPATTTYAQPTTTYAPAQYQASYAGQPWQPVYPGTTASVAPGQRVMGASALPGGAQLSPVTRQSQYK